MAQTPPLAVFDTNVFVQYFLNPRGIAAKCLTAVENREVELIVSLAMLAELRDVLLRPKILERMPDSSIERIEAYLNYVAGISTLVDPVPPGYSFDRDPKDEFLIDLALTARANFLVTRDKDLLELMTGYSAESKSFRQRFRRVKIVDPQEFLVSIRRS